MVKDKVITVRLSESEYKRIKKASANEERPISQLARIIVVRWLDKNVTPKK